MYCTCEFLSTGNSGHVRKNLVFIASLRACEKKPSFYCFFPSVLDLSMGTKQTINSSFTVPSSIQFHAPVVVYYTSLGAVHRTFSDCRNVLSTFHGFQVEIDKRDVHMDDGFREELQRIFKRPNVPLPSVFVHRKYIGGAEDVHRMCDSGELRDLIEELPKSQVNKCDTCDRSGFVVCGDCSGSHKVHMEKSEFRSCSSCNANGLIRCPACCVLPLHTKKDETKVAQKIVDATKNKLHMQSKDINSWTESGPYSTPNSGSEPISAHKIVYSNGQSSQSNPQPPGSELNSSRKFGSLTKEALDPLLKALENYDKYRFNRTYLKELSEKLQDHRIQQIGLHGKRGSGKTTFVEAVHDKAKSLKIFDAVLFATVSQNPNERNIQKQISESLNLKFGSEWGFERATKIRSTLSSMNQILVILDDVPAKFDPGKCMGINCKDKRCKFLFTTRSNDYSFGLDQDEIHCQHMIPMRSLSPDDAWRLLRKHSGIEDDQSNRSKMAKEITTEHEWLPGSIIERGKSLRGKGDDEWRGLLNSLAHSTARYHIFLSFRGTDTREHFTSTLNDELKKNGFKTFMDDDHLKDGDSISTELIQAIKDSRLSIVVLSEHYSNSSWCLDELVHILECQKTINQRVHPIFYKVEPTHVRHQTGGFGNAMAELEQEEKFKNNPEKIMKWKSALVEVAQLKGQTYKDGTKQHIFIKKTIETVLKFENYLYTQNMDMV